LATNAKFCSIDVVCPPSLAQSFARKDQRNLAALTLLAALTRAREAAADTNALCGRPTCTGRLLADGDFSFWRNCCWQIRRQTLALGRSASMLTSAFAWSGRRR
jgi:hypothetical protein